jgi:hypothetical protein
MLHPQLGATVWGNAMMAGVAAAKLYRGVGQKAWPALELGLELVRRSSLYSITTSYSLFCLALAVTDVGGPLVEGYQAC